MGRENCIVRLNYRGGDLGCRINTELKLALFAIIDGKPLHEQSTEARASAATERVENEETLKPRAVVCDTSNLVQNLVDQFFSDRVMSTSVII